MSPIRSLIRSPVSIVGVVLGLSTLDEFVVLTRIMPDRVSVKAITEKSTRCDL